VNSLSLLIKKVQILFFAVVFQDCRTIEGSIEKLVPLRDILLNEIGYKILQP